jgi:hypothetical protein
MGKAIVKIKDRYFEWSTIVDAPVSYGMTEEQIKEVHSNEKNFKERLERAKEKGHSYLGYYGTLTLDEILACNRAGDGETELTAEEIYDKYT